MAGPALTDMCLGVATNGAGKVLPDDGIITAGEVEIVLMGPGAYRFGDEIVTACHAHDDLMVALRAAKRLIDVALPTFDWSKSPLSADAIRILNETPALIEAALAKGEGSAS